MNNEPIAWTDGKGNYFDKNSFFPVDDLIPLYTHPADITDEEIEDFTVRIYNCRTGAEAHEIVLAILRKAQEK